VAENVRLYIASAGEALIVNICEGNGRMRGVEGRWNGADSMQWAGGVWERRVGLFFAANKAVVVGQVRTAGESLLATFGFSRCGVCYQNRAMPKAISRKSIPSFNLLTQAARSRISLTVHCTVLLRSFLIWVILILFRTSRGRAWIRLSS
jgi:hypothetical protein